MTEQLSVRQPLLLHAQARQHDWQGVGPLSLKTFRQGQALYAVAGGRHLVDERRYLLLNEGQEYTITVDSPTPVESFCIFFPPGFVEAVYHSLVSPVETLLDVSAAIPSRPLYFFERTYPHDEIISPWVARLHAFSRSGKIEPGQLHEELHQVAAQLLRAQQYVRREVDALPALRLATREELYQRIYRARDFMAASLDQPITLTEIAAVACLSPNHFLRTFKQIFHQSPHQYLTARRLEEAQRLLRQTDDAITEICLAVGFTSLGSFSWLFRKKVGMAPEQFRHGVEITDDKMAR